MENVECLSRLIEDNKDCSAWFRIAADESYDTPDLIGFFNTLSEERRIFVEELEDVLRAEGEDPAPPIARMVARAWRDTRSLVSREARDVTVRLASAVALQRQCLDDYQVALSLRWPEPIVDLITRQAAELESTQQRLLALEHGTGVQEDHASH